MYKHTAIERLIQVMAVTGLRDVTALEAVYVYDYIMRRYVLPIEPLLGLLSRQGFRDVVSLALRQGANELRGIFAEFGEDIPDTVSNLLDNGQLLAAISEWLRALDHDVAGGTSETCIAGSRQETLSAIAARAHRVLDPRDAYVDALRWHFSAYQVLRAARRAIGTDLTAVCECLNSGNVTGAADEVGIEVDW